LNPLNQTHLQSEGTHNRMTHTSDQAIVSPLSDKNFTNSNCEAYRCNNEATNQVTVSVGKLGEIDLNLCNSCVPIFKNTDKLTAVEKQLTFDRWQIPMLFIEKVSNKYLVTWVVFAALEQKKTKKIDTSKIRQHKTCKDFYQQRLRERQLRENQDQGHKTKLTSRHCHNKNCGDDCICNCKKCKCDYNQSCLCDRKSLIKDWNEGFGLISLWKDRCNQENSIFELDCKHGKDCKKINKCTTCTPIDLCTPIGERNAKVQNSKSNDDKRHQTLDEELRLQRKYQRQQQKTEDWNPLTEENWDQ